MSMDYIGRVVSIGIDPNQDYDIAIKDQNGVEIDFEMVTSWISKQFECNELARDDDFYFPLVTVNGKALSPINSKRKIHFSIQDGWTVEVKDTNGDIVPNLECDVGEILPPAIPLDNFCFRIGGRRVCVKW